MSNPKTDVIRHNSQAWDKFAKAECDWSKPVSQEIISNAKQGSWSVHITKTALTEDWLPKICRAREYFA